MQQVICVVLIILIIFIVINRSSNENYNPDFRDELYGYRDMWIRPVSKQIGLGQAYEVPSIYFDQPGYEMSFSFGSECGPGCRGSGDYPFNIMPMPGVNSENPGFYGPSPYLT